jgi:hypothetical protein
MQESAGDGVENHGTDSAQSQHKDGERKNELDTN